MIPPRGSDGKAPRPPDQDDIDTIALQLDRWSRAAEAQRAWASVAMQCQDFREGRQWTPEEEQALRDSGRYPLKINRIGALVRLLVGYLRMNRTQLRFNPSNDGVASEEGAAAIGATVKQLEEVNGSQWNDAEVFNDGIVAARGFYDYRLDFTHNAFGEVKERVLDPFAVYIDPEASSYDPADGWEFLQISHWLSWNAIVETFGKWAGDLVESRGGGAGRAFGSVIAGGVADDEISPERFFGLTQYLGDQDRFMTVGRLVPGSPYEHVDKHRKLIRVVECQHLKLRRVMQFVDLQTGLKKTIPDHWDRARIQHVVQFMEARGYPLAVAPALVKRVRHTITAADVLLYDDWSIYDTFTVVPYFAYFRRGKTMGMVEDLLDPQREINKRRSVYLHIAMTTANSGWIHEEDALDDEYIALMESEGARPGIRLQYRKGAKPPERINPAVPPMQLERLEQKAIQDLKEVSGINDSAMGNLDRVQSGRAVLARQRQSVVGAEEYFSNFSRTKELRGRKMVELVQNFYTEQRLIRYRGDDGERADLMVNRRMGAGVIANDITAGRYLVAIDETPMAQTFAGQEMDDLIELQKAGVPIPPDEIVESSNIPRKRRIAERIRQAMGVPAPGAGAPPPGTPPQATPPQATPSQAMPSQATPAQEGPIG